MLVGGVVKQSGLGAKDLFQALIYLFIASVPACPPQYRLV